MTVSTHVYSAVLIGTPDVDLAVRGGSITLDADSSPHVRADLEVALPDQATLDALDPRLGARVRITAEVTYPSFTNTRTFDLGLRERPTRHLDAVLSLSLASDEALLEDARALADDETPRDTMTSLRDVVNYILDEAAGAALEATPAIDADVTPYWSVTNMLLNPSVEGSTANWSPAGNCTLFHSSAVRTGVGSCGYTSTAAGVLFVSPMDLAGRTSVSAGREYTFSGYGRRATLPSGSTLTAVIRWVDAAGLTPWADAAGNDAVLNDTDFTPRSVVTAEAPIGAVSAFPLFRVAGASAGGQIGYIDDAMFHEGDRAVPFFLPTLAVPAGYAVDWADDANASTTTRTPDFERDPESLIWKAGETALDFLRPLVQAAGFRLVCNEAREWTLRDEFYFAAGSTTARYGVNLIDATDTLRRDGLWFDAQVTIYRWTDRYGIQRETVDSYALTTPPTRVNLVEIASASPGIGRSEYAVRRAQGRGREIDAELVARWTENAEQPVTVTLDGAPIQTGKTASVAFSLDNDRVTIVTRTTDTDPDAWVLQIEEAWTDGDPLETWLEAAGA